MKSNSNNILIVISVLILAVSLFNASKLNVQSFDSDMFSEMKSNLDSKSELADYSDQYPRITYITGEMVSNINNVEFFKDVKEGNLLLEYQGATALYDLTNDVVLNVQEFETIPADILDRLVVIPGFEAYAGITPAIIKITNENLVTLSEQISGLNESYLGMYILNYNDRVVVYDYDNNVVVGNIPLQTKSAIPEDFVTRLYAHSELVDYKDENPTGSILDQATLDAYKQQLPQIFASAAVGDFVLQFSDKIVIYDYNNDRIKGNFDI